MANLTLDLEGSVTLQSQRQHRRQHLYHRRLLSGTSQAAGFGGTPTQGGAATYTIGGLGTNTTFGGNTSTATRDLTKTGGGTLTLSGTNTMTGSATLTGGALRLANRFALGQATINYATGGAAASWPLPMACCQPIPSVPSPAYATWNWRMNWASRLRWKLATTTPAPRTRATSARGAAPAR